MSVLDRIPVELRERPQWVVWKLEQRPDDPKPTKVPYCASSAKRASTTDPTTWGTFEQACAALEAGGVNGIGYVFSPDDPYTGTDLDGCFDEGGDLHPTAAGFVACLGSYTELSPSGNGVHVFVKANLNGCSKHKTGKTPWKGDFEIYDRDRYFTVTGHHYPTTPETIESRQAEVEKVYAEVFPSKPAQATGLRNVVTQSVDVDDEELLELAFRSKNGTEIERLWRGDLAGHNDDHSVADLALCGHLAFWTGRDHARIDRLFRASGLMREKWARDDYRERTIAKAIEGCSEVFTPPARNVRPTIPESSEGAENSFRHPKEIDSGGKKVSGVEGLRIAPLHTALTHVPPEPPWLWDGYVAPGLVTLLAGRPKVGKSTLLSRSWLR